MITVNVASHLADFAAREPERAAVIVARNERKFTFRELHADSDALAHGLVAAGITRGTRVAVMVPPSLEFFSLVFALFKVAAVPVMIDPGMGMKNLGKCLAEAGPAAFIGIAKAHLARRLFGWAKRCITVNVGRMRFFCDHSTSSLRELGSRNGSFTPPEVTADEMAAILFTSGSTGLAKGVVYTHGIFAAQVQLLKQIYGIEPGEIDLCTFPLFALFGPALGMTCIVPTMDFSRPIRIDPLLTIGAIKKYRVTNLFGSPAVIRRLCERGNFYGDKLPSLRRAISAGAPARLDEVKHFSRMLPQGAELFTPYGATESLPVANIGSDELLATKSLTESGRGICLGRPVPGVAVHIIPITDEAVTEFDLAGCLPPGQIGEFVVRGPIVTKSYWRRDEATKLAKINDPVTGETLHRMGDVGYYDESGALWFCGRKSHRVLTSLNTYHTEMVESIFNTINLIKRSALVSVFREDRYHPVLCVEPRKVMPPFHPKGADWDPDAIETKLIEIGKQHEITRGINLFLIYSYRGGFPVDPRHNSKINREQLAIWAAKQLQGERRA